MEKAFINKKPYVTKKGVSRPGRVTVLSDDRDSAKRVRALYDWVERDKPKEQEPKRRPFEDDSIINKDALKDPKTLKAVADIFDKADRRTVVASEEGDVRVEYDVSKDGKPIPGTTRVLDKGRVMITDFAIDPKLGLDGSLSRTKKWVEGLNGGPKDTLAIYVNPETKAVRFTGRGAERVSQENGIDLEEVVPRMNREGIPVIVMIGNRANVAWPDARPSKQEALVSAPDDPKSWNVHVDRPANTRPGQQIAQAPKPAPEPNVKHQTQQTQTSSKPQTPAKPKVEGTQAEQEALDELNELLGDIGMLREGPNVEETSDSGSSQPHDDSLLRERAGVGRAESLSTRPSITNPITRLQEKIVWLEHAADTLVVPGAQRKAVKLNAGNFIFTVSDALDLEKARNTNSHYGDFVPLEQRDGTMIGLRISDHPIGTKNAEGAAVSNRLSIVVSKGRVSRRALEPSDAAQVVEYRYNRAMLDDGRIKALLSDLAGYLRTGKFANRSRGNLVAVAPMPQTGMLREGPGLSPEQRTRVQNAMNKVVAASVETGGVRTFRDLVKRLYGMLRDANRKLWEAMKPLLRAAWVGYGDTHEDLNLDEPSRAEARAIFEEVERGDAEPEAAQEPARSGTLETETQGKETDNERTGIQSASGQVGGAVGGQEPSRDGGDGVGGVGAGVPGRGVSVPGGVDVSSGLAGEQPAEGVSDDAAGVGGRAGKRGEDGGAVSGATLPVQLERGDRGVRAGGDAEQSAGGDGGRGQGAAQGVQPPAEEPRPLTDDRAATANYVIPEAGNGGLDAITNARERIAANLSALRVLKALQKEGRQATVAEQRTLSLYTGWGSLGEQLFNDQNPDWAEERAELKGLLTEAEYASARRTVQYAHYTPMDVVRGMYDALGLMGVRGANLSAYEAGLGVGRFIGGLPEGLRPGRPRPAGGEDDHRPRPLRGLRPLHRHLPHRRGLRRGG